jgi:hypothetical protein
VTWTRLLCAMLFFFASGVCALWPQALEVQESSGFVEARIPQVGWRQAVIGRQLPVESVAASWLGARARMEYRGCFVTLGSLGHLAVERLEENLVRLSLAAGSLQVQTGDTACEIGFRGLTVTLRGGSIEINDGLLRVREGTATVSAPGEAPVTAGTGATLSLLPYAPGPVLPGTNR